MKDVNENKAMEIGLSSASFYPDINTEESIRLMKSLGFDMGEIFLNSPSEYEESFIQQLNEEKYKNQFTINSLHSFSSAFEPYLFDVYKRRREDMFVYFKNVCRGAKILGAKCYTFHGMRLDNINTINKDLVIDTYNKLCYTALEEGIKLAQENVSWCMSSNLDFLKLLSEKCKYPIYFTFDIKQAYKSGEKVEDYLNIMGKSLVNFHINDMDDNNNCSIPGKGKIDYKKIYDKLCEIGYTGAGIIEIYRNNYEKYTEIVEGRKNLRKIFI